MDKMYEEFLKTLPPIEALIATLVRQTGEVLFSQLETFLTKRGRGGEVLMSRCMPGTRFCYRDDKTLQLIVGRVDRYMHYTLYRWDSRENAVRRGASGRSWMKEVGEDLPVFVLDA
jgi:hypothetical protein